MRIVKNSVVSIHYTLKNQQGEILDTSLDSEPLTYLHGYNNIIKGLEQQLEGHKPGEKISVTVNPEDGYGTLNENLKIKVSKKLLPENVDWKNGIQIQAIISPDETPRIYQVVNVLKDEVYLDGNHPLAGKILVFTVEIIEVREAIEKEIFQEKPLS